jgi:hypothetical protein
MNARKHRERYGTAASAADLSLAIWAQRHSRLFSTPQAKKGRRVIFAPGHRPFA